MADTEFSNKLNTGLRYGVTVGGTAFTVMAGISLISPEQLIALKADLETLKTSVLTGYGALVNMWAILGPVAIAIAVKMGWSSSSVQAMGSKLFKIATSKAETPAKVEEAKVVLVNAASSPEIGSSGVVNPELAKLASTSPNVVASASDVPAKAA